MDDVDRPLRCLLALVGLSIHPSDLAGPLHKNTDTPSHHIEQSEIEFDSEYPAQSNSLSKPSQHRN